MKKLLSSVLVAGLLGVVGANAADNQIVIQGTVTAGAVVGFSDMSAESLGSGSTAVLKFKDPGAAIDFGQYAPGETMPSITKDLFVKTNTSGVSIPIDESRYNDKLYQAIKEKGLKLSYKVMGSSYTIGSYKPLEVASNPNYGRNPVGYIEVIPSSVKLPEGTYKTTLIASISLR